MSIRTVKIMALTIMRVYMIMIRLRTILSVIPMLLLSHRQLKKQKTEKGSIFMSLSDKYQSLELVASATKDEELAEFVNSSFQSGITEDKQTELVKDIHLSVSS